MRTRWSALRPGLVLAFVCAVTPALGADAGTAAPASSAATAAPANPHGGSVHGAADEEEDEAGGGSPHGHGGDEGDDPNGMFRAPPDGSKDDPSLPKGSLAILIADGTGKPMPGTTVTLGILFNSVAKGDSRKRVTGTTNDRGVAVFEHLDTGSSVAYRPMVITEGATFSVMPFRLSDTTGMRALLHVYPVVEQLDASKIASQSIVLTEVKDDRIQIQQMFKIFNFGTNAWVPKDFIIPLPEAFTGFSSQQGMTDISVDAVPKQGVRMHGTFGPGQHVVEFRWQLPYGGESEVGFEVGQAPRTAAARVIAPASKDMKLEVAGFPPPQASADDNGQRSLITQKQISPQDTPIKSVTISIKGLPTEGPAKIVATLLAAAGLAFGLYLGTKKPEARDRAADRARILAELEELELAHRDGDIGPKTYERTRRELVDALARTFSTDAPKTKTRKPRPAIA